MDHPLGVVVAIPRGDSGSIPILFRRYSSRSSDGVTLSKFRRMMSETGVGISQHRIDELFGFLDASRRGLVNDKDFVKGIFKDI